MTPHIRLKKIIKRILNCLGLICALIILSIILDGRDVLSTSGSEGDSQIQPPFFRIGFDEVVSKAPEIVTLRDIVISGTGQKIMINSLLVNKAYWNVKKVSGYLFVIGEILKEGPSSYVPFPKVETINGVPVDYKKGITFSILWQRPVRVSLNLPFPDKGGVQIHFYAFSLKGASLMNKILRPRLPEPKEKTRPDLSPDDLSPSPSEYHEDRTSDDKSEHVHEPSPGRVSSTKIEETSPPPSIGLRLTKALRAQLDESLRAELREPQPESPRYPIPFSKEPSVPGNPVPSTQDGLPTPSPDGSSWRMLYRKALQLLEEGKPKEALNKLLFLSEKIEGGPLRESILYSIGDSIYLLGMTGKNPNSIVKAYEKALSAYPKSQRAPEAHYRIGLAYREMGFLLESNIAFSDLIDRYPDHLLAKDALFLQGENLVEFGKLKEGAKIIEDAIKGSPMHQRVPKGMFYLAFSFERLGDLNMAEKVLEEALSRSSDALSWPKYILYDIGRVFFKQAQYARYRSIIHRVINIFPDKDHEKTLVSEVARSYALEGRWDEALKVYLYGIARWPETEQERHNLMEVARLWTINPSTRVPFRVLQRNPWGSPQELYADYVRRFPLDAQVPEAMLKRGEIHRDKGEFKEAVALFNTILDKYGESPFSKKALIALQSTVSEVLDGYYGKGSYERIVAFHLQELQGSMRRLAGANASYQLAESYRRMGLLTRAIPFYKKAIETSTFRDQTDRFLYSLAESYLTQERWPEAAQTLESLLRDHPTSPFIPKGLELLGEALARDGRFEEVLATLTLKREVLTLKGLYWLARSFEATGDLVKGTAIYRSILISVDDKTMALGLECRIRLADLLFRLKRYTEALHEYQIIAREHPEDFRFKGVLYQIARCRVELGDVKGAMEVLKMLEKKSEDPLWTAAATNMLKFFELQGVIVPESSEAMG